MKPMWEEYIKAQRTPETPEFIQRFLEENPSYITDSPPINDLQSGVVDLAWALTGGDTNRSAIITEFEAAQFVRSQYQRWRNSKLHL